MTLIKMKEVKQLKTNVTDMTEINYRFIHIINIKNSLCEFIQLLAFKSVLN